MGMYDDVHFDYRMPDGYKAFAGYQTKDLDLELDTYEVSPSGRLIRTSASNDRPTGDMNFDGALHIYTSDFGRSWHAYDLEFKNGTLMTIYCHQTEGRLLFEPSPEQGALPPAIDSGNDDSSKRGNSRFFVYRRGEIVEVTEAEAAGPANPILRQLLVWRDYLFIASPAILALIGIIASVVAMNTGSGWLTLVSLACLLPPFILLTIKLFGGNPYHHDT